MMSRIGTLAILFALAAVFAAPALGQDFSTPAGMGGFEAAEDLGLPTSCNPPGCPRFPTQRCDGTDVVLGQLYGFVQWSRTGTFPNGESGFTAATTSCNNGCVRVNWFAPMAVDHPAITLNLYRLTTSRLEQIGAHYVKHGFFALSNNQCFYGCEGNSGGSQLWIGCSDTYGTGNNADRNYLGPRKEWNAFTGVWTCVGSHFSGGQPDCIRRHGSGGHTGVDHYTRVKDSDMNVPGAQFYYDGYYLIREDVNITNNFGYKPVTLTWNGTSWSASSSGSGTPPTYGIILNAAVWGTEHVDADTAGESGQVHVAAKVTDNGNGTQHYEYAVYNVSYDRRIRSFSVPKSAATQITNIGFHGPLMEEQSQAPWTATVDASSCTWSTETFAQNPNANAILWASLYNFWFDANVPPDTSQISMEPFLPGPGIVLTARVSGPSTTAIGCGDFDGDGDVDLTDFTNFQLCFGGSSNPPPPTCPPGVDADCDGDGDVDMGDFLIFQQNYTGSLSD